VLKSLDIDTQEGFEEAVGTLNNDELRRSEGERTKVRHTEQQSVALFASSRRPAQWQEAVHRLPRDRYNLPNNERNRLMLSFSKNGFDWCFAGMVAVGRYNKQSRHYASILLDGDDLLVLSRSADEQAPTPHNGGLITLHRVKDFRNLIY